MISRFLYDAKQELKRSDHLVYVSLKYTRTIDVMNNILERLVSTFDFAIDGMLDKAKNEGKIKGIVAIPGVKVEKIKELFPEDKAISEYLDFYLLLRKISNAPQRRMWEFRRGVTMSCIVDKQEIEVTIDIITDYYKKVVDFIIYIEDNKDRFFEEEEDD